MTTQDSKQIALTHLERLNTGDIAGAAALIAEDCINHAAVPEAQGRRGFTSIQAKLRTAFPDMKYTLEDTIADGDKVVLRMTCAGTQTGPITFLRFPLEATGKPVKFEQIHVMRVANGQIVEHWLGQDTLAFMRQLGLSPQPA